MSGETIERSYESSHYITKPLEPHHLGRCSDEVHCGLKATDQGYGAVALIVNQDVGLKT